MAQSQLRPPKTAMLVARRIVADMHKNSGRAGDRLPPEKEMLEQYQIGRGTLRESLRFLELQGLISLKPGPGGGPVLEQPDGSGLAITLMLLLQFENAPYRTISEARTGVEPTIARLAATRLSDDELARLAQNLEAMGENLDNEAVFLELNEEFHDIIAHASHNPLFAHLIDALTGILDGSAIGISYPEPRREAVHAAHARIHRALVARDELAAETAMRDHISEYSRYAELKFPEVLDQPISWGNGNS